MADQAQDPAQPGAAVEAAAAPGSAGQVEVAGADRRSSLERFRDGVRANQAAVMWIVPLSVGVMGLAWYWLNAEAPMAPVSRLDPGSVVTSNPLEPTSPAYRGALEAEEAERREEAEEEGESYMPAFQSQGPVVEAVVEPVVEPVVEGPVMPSAQAPSVAVAQTRTGEVSAAPAQEEDPMLQREYPVPEARGTELVQREVAQGEGPGLGELFEQLLTRWNEAPKMTVIRYEVAQGEPGGNVVAAATGAGQGAAPGEVLLEAGRMLYASTMVGVDSELGLPVLVELHEKPFRGALLKGQFQQVRDRMVVQFSRLTDPRRGLDVGVSAYAVGFECECGAVEGEVDRHWFARVVLPAAFGFAEEYLRAVAEPDTRISIDGVVVAERSEDEVKDRVARGLAGAVGQAGKVVIDGLPKRATVRLPRGTELAVVFVDAVREAGEGRG